MTSTALRLRAREAGLRAEARVWHEAGLDAFDRGFALGRGLARDAWYELRDRYRDQCERLLREADQHERLRVELEERAAREVA